jgi:HK97 family phage prohead protease
MSAFKIRDFDLSIKSVAEDGTFSGYASVFGVVDTSQEDVAPNSFTETLAAAEAKGRKFPILFQHDNRSPIGVWDSLKEDGRGLFGNGSLWLDDAPMARVVYRGMKAAAFTGLSIGYFVRESSFDERTGVRTLKKLDLIEASVVVSPANDEARIDAVKMKLAHGSLPTLPEFERLLRESGFSKSQSAVIANRGLAHVLRSESGGDQEFKSSARELINQLNGFSLPKL